MPILPRPGMALWYRQRIVVQFFRGGLFEGADRHRLRVDAAHHMLDGAVLAGGVQSLEYQEHAERVLGVEPVLIVGEQLHPLGEQGGGVRVGDLPGIARIVVTAQSDRAARRHPQRFNEVSHEAEMLVHSLTMPAEFIIPEGRGDTVTARSLRTTNTSSGAPRAVATS